MNAKEIEFRVDGPWNIDQIDRIKPKLDLQDIKDSTPSVPWWLAKIPIAVSDRIGNTISSPLTCDLSWKSCRSCVTIRP